MALWEVDHFVSPRSVWQFLFLPQLCQQSMWTNIWVFAKVMYFSVILNFIYLLWKVHHLFIFFEAIYSSGNKASFYWNQPAFSVAKHCWLRPFPPGNHGVSANTLFVYLDKVSFSPGKPQVCSVAKEDPLASAFRASTFWVVGPQMFTTTPNLWCWVPNLGPDLCSYFNNGI